MRQLFSDVFQFIYTILSYWQALATGGIVTGVVGLFERLSGYHLTKRAYVALFVGTFLLVAFFMGWREERAGRLRQEAEINRMLAVKPRLKGDFEYFRIGPVSGLPSYLGVATIMSISNVGSTPSIADHWNCYLNMETGNGVQTVKGEPRAFPEGLEMPRGNNNVPMLFERDDALYVKAMRTPITPGAKIVGVMFCIFPGAGLGNFRTSDANNLTVEFRDVLGERHEVKLFYLNHPGFRYDNKEDKAQWVDIPGMDRPPTVPQK